ncbi:hypothetical protein J5N97_027622 [Dioscorea zingiberensis]|uniref:U3 small nucleolar ribonucleoprotein protein MPP10 n=1 Tax=Dioscorea zingiberensis TaxID=325984 RepID=A0A9D5BXL1_9LILI|nr:hypothetical protein J5N97_027622 [Dioscorea zingiberensis]
MAETLAALEATKRLVSTEPPLFLSPSPELAGIARFASAELFSSLVPSCPKSPLDRLLVDDGFDAEQIWQQIDVLSCPLLSSLRRELKRLQRDPPATLSTPSEDDDDEDNHKDIQVGDGAEEAYEDNEEDEGEPSEERDEGEEEEEDADEDGEEGKEGGVEDRFLKIKELEEYLEKDEAREYGIPGKKGRKAASEDDDDDASEEEGDEDEGGLDFGDFEGDEEEEEEADGGEDVRYEDFFGSKKKKGSQTEGVGAKRRRSLGKVEVLDDSDDLEIDDNQRDDSEEDDDDSKDDRLLSTHERELQNIQAKIRQMEKENLETKSWTMQGEVTAAKRPKNSALEVNLDFDHKVNPPPVITDEITVSLEDLIKRRIVEGHYDDVQRAPALPVKAPKERKELDENKSQKGLAEIYEEEYAQKTGLASAALSSSDEQKKEASILFKRLCLKLDALSHFHFAPKPVIEDMSVQLNVPALAMEEIAPLAVSDSAMLAPEEVFQGRGDIKEEAELTQTDRKRRRANKKRKFKVKMADRATKKPRENTTVHKSTGSKDL